MAMLFCFSSPKDEEYLALSSNEVLPEYDDDEPGEGGPHDEAYDNQVNASLQLAGRQDDDNDEVEGFENDNNNNWHMIGQTNNNSTSAALLRQQQTSSRIRPSVSCDSIDSATTDAFHQVGGGDCAGVDLNNSDCVLISETVSVPVCGAQGGLKSLATNSVLPSSTHFRKVASIGAGDKLTLPPKSRQQQHGSHDQNHGNSPGGGSIKLVKLAGSMIKNCGRGWNNTSGVDRHLQQEVLRLSKEGHRNAITGRYVHWSSSSSPTAVIRTTTATASEALTTTTTTTKTTSTEKETSQLPTSCVRTNEKTTTSVACASQHSQLLTVDCANNLVKRPHSSNSHQLLATSPRSQAIILSACSPRRLGTSATSTKASISPFEAEEELSTSVTSGKITPPPRPRKTIGIDPSLVIASPPTLPPRCGRPPPRPKTAKPIVKRRATTTVVSTRTSPFISEHKTHAWMSPDGMLLGEPKKTTRERSASPSITRNLSSTSLNTMDMTSITLVSTPTSVSNTNNNNTTSANGNNSTGQQQQPQQQSTTTSSSATSSSSSRSTINRSPRAWLDACKKIGDDVVHYEMRVSD